MHVVKFMFYLTLKTSVCHAGRVISELLNATLRNLLKEWPGKPTHIVILRLMHSLMCILFFCPGPSYKQRKNGTDMGGLGKVFIFRESVSKIRVGFECGSLTLCLNPVLSIRIQATKA